MTLLKWTHAVNISKLLVSHTWFSCVCFGFFWSLCQLSSSFAPVIITRATRGPHLTINVNIGSKKCLFLRRLVYNMSTARHEDFISIIYRFQACIGIQIVCKVVKENTHIHLRPGALWRDLHITLSLLAMRATSQPVRTVLDSLSV